MNSATRLRVGLLINPYAGVGGPIALKGSDGIVAEALAAGVVPLATSRALRAIKVMEPLWPRIDWATGGGALGEDMLYELGQSSAVVYRAPKRGSRLASTAADSIVLASRLTECSLDLMLFVGGDGTACDVLKGMQVPIPMVGIPAGVKMQSAVFGVSPPASGMLAVDFLTHARRATAPLEVMDLDENLLREGVVAPKLFGYMPVPVNTRYLQGRKVRSPELDAVQAGSIAHRVTADMKEAVTYLVGPGSTTFAVKKRLRLEGSLLGVDIIRDGEMLQSDATEAQIWSAIQAGTSHLLLSCIGGQGHVIGRGNAQLSPRILKWIGPAQLTVLATDGKLSSLRGRPFQIDSGDTDIDELYSGPVHVCTGFNTEVWYQIQTASDTSVIS